MCINRQAEEEEYLAEQLHKCPMCKDYDDTWDINCFCDKCKKLIGGEE